MKTPCPKCYRGDGVTLEMKVDCKHYVCVLCNHEWDVNYPQEEKNDWRGK